MWVFRFSLISLSSHPQKEKGLALRTVLSLTYLSTACITEARWGSYHKPLAQLCWDVHSLPEEVLLIPLFRQVGHIGCLQDDFMIHMSQIHSGEDFLKQHEMSMNW